MIAAELFKRGMHSLGGGVCIVTTLDDQKRHGLIVTAVVSVSADQPSLLISVDRSAPAHDPIVRSGIFCVNMLHRTDEKTARIFASTEQRGVRFASGAWTTLETGAPVFVDALASFDCRVAQIVPFGSQTIWIGKVIAMRRSDETVDPHLHADGCFAGLTSDEADHGPDAGLHGLGRGHAAGRGAEAVAIRR